MASSSLSRRRRKGAVGRRRWLDHPRKNSEWKRRNPTAGYHARVDVQGATVEMRPSVDMPVDYLESFEIRAYDLDLTLRCYPQSPQDEDQPQSLLEITPAPTFAGRVVISAKVISGPPRSVFYLHSSGLKISRATVGRVPAKVELGGGAEAIFGSGTRATKLEVPPEAAFMSGAELSIEVEFSGKIMTQTPEGVSMLRRQNHGFGGYFRPPPSQPDESASVVTISSEADASAGHAIPQQFTAFPAESVMGTHLEPTHARDLFPCIDLPSCKATFHMTLRGVPRQLRAISNSPVSRVENYEEEEGTDSTETSGGIHAFQVSQHQQRYDQDRHPLHSDDAAERSNNSVTTGISRKRHIHELKTVVFEPTPIMPTYILGFWVGDFHSLTTQALATEGSCCSPLFCCGDTPVPTLPVSSTKAVTVNVQVLKPAKLDGARFALDFTRRAFELFSRLFTVPFPFPKLDVLGLPRMHGLGMENFGAVTLLENYMLVTAETSFVRRRRIARLICHEVCHQWYGDIVTPQSFDELWLKEGLARFFEYVAVDTLDQGYRVWTNFMREVFFQAMLADSQKRSHPVVQQHNGNISSILESFDTITYCKGASVLRMLCHCVGPSRFLEGTRRFVVDHQFASATQEDLWKAVQGVCDRDEVEMNVRDLMRTWLTCERFPVLRVRMADESRGDTLLITQQPFSFYGLSGDTDARSPTGGNTFLGRDSDAANGKEPTHTSVGAAAPGKSNLRRGLADATRVDSTTGVGQEDATNAANFAPDLAAKKREPEPRFCESSGGLLQWVIPLRIRVGNGLKAAATVDEEKEGSTVGRTGQLERSEEVHDVMMTESSTSVYLGSLASSAEGEVPSTLPDEDRSGQMTPSRPYVVINDGHSGFFTVQYDCERSWALAISALESGTLNDCEAMGFVHDLILGLHEGVLVDRGALGIAAVTDGIRMSRAAGSSADDTANLERNEGQQDANQERGDGNFCTVSRLFARLQDVVKLLSRDRSHPAWCPGQLFVWELLVVCASNALADVEKLQSRLLRESRSAAKWRLDKSLAHSQDATAADGTAEATTEVGVGRDASPKKTTDCAGTERATAAAVGGDGEVQTKTPTTVHDSVDAAEAPSPPAASSTRMDVDANDCVRDEAAHCDQGTTSGAATAATACGPAEYVIASPTSSNRHGQQEEGAPTKTCENADDVSSDHPRAKNGGAEIATARANLARILEDLRQATANMNEHVVWYEDRVARGDEQAAEPSQSLAAMRDRIMRMVHRCETQLSSLLLWRQANTIGDDGALAS